MQAVVTTVEENLDWSSLRFFQDDELAAEQIAGKTFWSKICSVFLVPLARTAEGISKKQCAPKGVSRFQSARYVWII